MNTHRNTRTAAAILTGITLAITGCGSSSGTGQAASTAVSPTPIALDRSNVATVAAAFAADYAGGNTPAACTLSTSRLVTKMTALGLCTGSMSWSEVPTQIEACPIEGGQAHYVYQVGHEIQRFLIFGIKLTQTNGVWAVDQLGGHTPGDKDYGCTGASSTSGG